MRACAKAGLLHGDISLQAGGAYVGWEPDCHPHGVRAGHQTPDHSDHLREAGGAVVGWEEQAGGGWHGRGHGAQHQPDHLGRYGRPISGSRQASLVGFKHSEEGACCVASRPSNFRAANGMALWWGATRPCDHERIAHKGCLPCRALFVADTSDAEAALLMSYEGVQAHLTMLPLLLLQSCVADGRCCVQVLLWHVVAPHREASSLVWPLLSLTTGTAEIASLMSSRKTAPAAEQWDRSLSRCEGHVMGPHGGCHWHNGDNQRS